MLKINLIMSGFVYILSPILDLDKQLLPNEDEYRLLDVECAKRGDEAAHHNINVFRLIIVLLSRFASFHFCCCDFPLIAVFIPLLSHYSIKAASYCM